MKKAVKFISAAFMAASVLFPLGASGAAEGNLIQMAILLDTSNSMDGLIDQAKSQLWRIVNELSQARKNGQSPRLEVALYEYGKSSLPEGEGYLRMIVPFTTELDRISEELFALTTNGGDEYCGRVVSASLKGLKWSKGQGDLRMIFIAGNEPYTQGEVSYEDSAKLAVSKGVTVNTIFCGSFQEGVDTKWKDGAARTNGRYMNIDQNQQIAEIRAPQDDEIARLGGELNSTYIAYGQAGAAKKERQEAQDMKAASVNKGVLVERSVAKASEQYDNTGWDLVDAEKNKSVNVETMKEKDLPDEMKKMSPGQRKQYVEKQSRKRAELQKSIQKLSEERRVYVEKEMKKQSEGNTLDAAIIKSVRSLATDKGFAFK
jgi:hypothetical protein